MSTDGRERLPILRGRIDIAERFQSPKGGRRPRPATPERDPGAHQQLLVAQLDDIFRAVGRREMEDRDVAADRELVILRPEPGYEVSAESFGDKRQDVRVISVDEATGAVLIDAPRPDLPHIRSKLERYADDSKVNKESGTRRGELAVAPLKEVRLAALEDLAGPRLLAALTPLDGQTSLGADQLRWCELSCRGGLRERTAVTYESRMQIQRRLAKLERPEPLEFLAAERLVLFARLSVNDLRALVAATDCLYEVDLAGAPVRDWLLLSYQGAPARDLQSFRLTSPPPGAPSVVSLDTGVASGHPMLAPALLSASSVVPSDPSPEDLHGHGTLQAGVVLYEDIGALVEQNEASAGHWLQSVKVLRREGDGTAADAFRAFWPLVTQDAVRVAEEQAAAAGGAVSARHQIFAMAVTAPHDDPPSATLWSNALGQLAYNDGRGRLFCVSIGNSDVNDTALAQGYPILHLDQRIEDPAQAANVLTVGAYTTRDSLPPDPDYKSLTCLAPAGGVSPWTRAGVPRYAIKPDVVFEGGNAAFDDYRGWRDIETLSTITTGKDWARNPLAVHAMTSCATAHAARFAAQLWAGRPDLRPETVRALIVHSARWTPQMRAQFPNIEQRLALCGYGVPNLDLATSCLRERATVIVEDAMPNAVEAQVEDASGQSRRERRIKFFRLPIPEDALLASSEDGDVELRVTLSYFSEPSTIRRRERHGLDLAFDVQGASETEEDFRRRMNKLLRQKRTAGGDVAAGEDEEQDAKAEGSPLETGNSQGGPARSPTQVQRGGWRDKWEIGVQRRARGTVQSDFIVIPAALLAGPKLIAVYPVLGWWDERLDTAMEEQPFALVVTITAPGRDVYTAIELALRADVHIEVPTL